MCKAKSRLALIILIWIETSKCGHTCVVLKTMFCLIDVNMTWMICWYQGWRLGVDFVPSWCILTCSTAICDWTLLLGVISSILSIIWIVVGVSIHGSAKFKLWTDDATINVAVDFGEFVLTSYFWKLNRALIFFWG